MAMKTSPFARFAHAGSASGVLRGARIAVQSAALASLWLAVGFGVRLLHLPMPGGVRIGVHPHFKTSSAADGITSAVLSSWPEHRTRSDP